MKTHSHDIKAHTHDIKAHTHDVKAHTHDMKTHTYIHICIYSLSYMQIETRGSRTQGSKEDLYGVCA